MAGTIKREHPKHSRIWTFFTKGDFIDGYAATCDLPLDQAMHQAFAFPRWAAALLNLRNRLVAPFGLKTGDAETSREHIFPIHHQDAQEIILGTDDAHLNFRISLLKHDQHIHMATWVHPNNFWGRAYLTVVMPFHILIVRNCMKRIGTA